MNEARTKEFAAEHARRKKLQDERALKNLIYVSKDSSMVERAAAKKRIDQIDAAMKIGVGLGQSGSAARTKPKGPMIPGKDYDPLNLTPGKALKLMYDRFSAIKESDKSKGNAYDKHRGELERRIWQKFSNGEIKTVQDLWRESDDILHTLSGSSPKLERKTAYDPKINLSKTIKQATSKNGKVVVTVTLPFSQESVPITFDHQPSLRELASRVNEADRQVSVAKGVQHYDISRSLDKMSADAVQAKLALMFKKKFTTAKGGENLIRTNEMAQEVADVMGFTNWKNLLNVNSSEYKLFRAQVSGTNITQDSQDKNFEDAGVSSWAAGIIRRNPGLENENNWGTYTRALATVMSPSEMASMLGGDPRDYQEISKSKIRIGNFEFNENSYRTFADVTANIITSGISPGNIAGLAKLGTAAFTRIGTELFGKELTETLIRVGGRDLFGKTAEKVAAQVLRQIANGTIKVAPKIGVQFAKGVMKNTVINAVSQAPNVVKNALDRSASTGEDFGTSLSATAVDAAKSSLALINPATLTDSSKSPLERVMAAATQFGAVLNHAPTLGQFSPAIQKYLLRNQAEILKLQNEIEKQGFRTRGSGRQSGHLGLPVTEANLCARVVAQYMLSGNLSKSEALEIIPYTSGDLRLISQTLDKVMDNYAHDDLKKNAAIKPVYIEHPDQIQPLLESSHNRMLFADRSKRGLYYNEKTGARAIMAGGFSITEDPSAINVGWAASSPRSNYIRKSIERTGQPFTLIGANKLNNLFSSHGAVLLKAESDAAIRNKVISERDLLQYFQSLLSKKPELLKEAGFPPSWKPQSLNELYTSLHNLRTSNGLQKRIVEYIFSRDNSPLAPIDDVIRNGTDVDLYHHNTGDVIGLTYMSGQTLDPGNGFQHIYDDTLEGHGVGRAPQGFQMYDVIPDFRTRPGIMGHQGKMYGSIDRRFWQPTDRDAIFRGFFPNLRF